jgi:hypothetical protein
MYLPQGMILTAEESTSDGNKPALKLMKNIYGLKQVGRLWHQMLCEKLRELNYQQSSVDVCLYYKIMIATLIIVHVCVDDLLVASNGAKMVDEFFEQMKSLMLKTLMYRKISGHQN